MEIFEDLSESFDVLRGSGNNCNCGCYMQSPGSGGQNCNCRCRRSLGKGGGSDCHCGCS